MGNKGKVRASHILVQKHSDALKIISRLNEGEDFKKLAKEFSECPSRKKGGDLGWFARGQMVREFESAVYNMNVGQTTHDPVKTKFGYHVIRRTG